MCQYLKQLNSKWAVSSDGKSLAKKISFKNYLQCLDYMQKIGGVAEKLFHHPDLHLTGFRNVEVGSNSLGFVC